MNRRSGLALTLLSASTFAMVAGCGGGGYSPPPPPPPPPPQISVSITSFTGNGIVEAGGTVSITAQIFNDSSTKGMTWSISCLPSSPPCGTVSPTSAATNVSTTMYTAPNALPASNVQVTITATSVADPTQFNSIVLVYAAIAVNLSPSVGQVQAGGMSVITAMVNNDPANKGVDPASWTLTQAGTACSPGCGTLSAQMSSSATYTAPAALPAVSINVTITATALSDPRQSGNTMVIYEAIHISVSPKPASVAEDTSAQFTATVSFDPSNGGVTWTLVQGPPPIPCSPACGTLSAANPPSATTIVYNAPGIVPTPPTLELTATSVTDTRQSDTSIIPVLNPDSALNGQYAFLFSGFDDATGQQIATAGSFTADGFGSITKGVEDINGPAGPQTGVAFTGTYGIGLDNRGTATFTTLGGSVTYAFDVGSFNFGVAAKGRLIEFDDTTGTTGTRGSGFLRLQDPTAFSQAKITGPYGFGISGQDSKAGRLATAGIFSADGAGNISGGLEDINDAGTVTNSVNFTGSYIAPDATNGRATGNFSTAPTTHFSLYVVSASEALLITTDTESTAGLESGSVLSQVSAPYSNTSLNGSSVFYEVGVNSASPTTKSDVQIGLFTANGSGGLSITSDENDGGTFTANSTISSLTCSVASNGRVTITGGTGSEPILYLVDNNKAFVLGTSASVSSGFLEPQSGAPFSAFSFSGTFSFGMAPPAVTASTVFSGLEVATNSFGFPRRIFHTFRVMQDSSASNGTLTSGGTAFSPFTVSPDGRTTTGNGAVIYRISLKKFVLIHQGDAAPTVSIFEQ